MKIKQLTYFQLLVTSLVAILCLLAACTNDFLNVPPEGQAKGETFFTTSEDAERSVNAIYGNLRQWSLVGFANLAITSISSDDADKGSVPGDAGFLDDYDQFRITSTQFLLNDYWKGQYQGINLCNQAIQNIPTIKMDESLKVRLIGEAKFLRALHYFNLVRAFGGVPIVIKLPTTPDELNPTRASKEEIYAQIEIDFNDAAQTLPMAHNASDLGRATMGAAKAFLAKVKMYKKEWSAVMSLTEQLYGTNYNLLSDYNSVFRIVGENSPESIFEIQNQTYTSDCGSYCEYSNCQYVRPVGWGFNTPSTNLENAFEPTDKRKELTFMRAGEITPEGDLIPASSPNPSYNQKIYVPQVMEVKNLCGYGYGREQNVRIMRFAEVMLMRAEAANELGQTDTALANVNKIRTRAGLAALAITDKEALKMAIWQERRVEMALENDRFFDLVRQGRAGEVLRNSGKSFIDNVHEIFPIPQTQIDLSAGKLTQNPGY
ncbi:MAG: RagB/SusD family nutrient uptake outer membrane protein [Cytophagales bacterium]